MAESGVFDFAAHLDLPKKFGFKPAANLSAESSAALDAIAAAGMAIEINRVSTHPEWPEGARTRLQ